MVPNHLAVIMDGNGRWANARHLPRTVGHKVGFDRFVDLVSECETAGVKYLTVYAFSTENLSRAKDEVSALFSLAEKAMELYEAKLIKRNIRGIVLGDRSRFGEELLKKIEICEEHLSVCTGMTLCICFCYGGRREIAEAINKAVKNGETEFDEETLRKYLYCPFLPDPDLIIRTSGEKRISNFLLWQSAYSEYYFTDTLWPDFDKNELYKAFDDFGTRKRRFGK